MIEHGKLLSCSIATGRKKWLFIHQSARRKNTLRICQINEENGCGKMLVQSPKPKK